MVKLDDAYGVGVGSYDILSVRWAYGHFPPDETAARLDAIMQEGLMSETRFMAHTDTTSAPAPIRWRRCGTTARTWCGTWDARSRSARPDSTPSART